MSDAERERLANYLEKRAQEQPVIISE
jgi:hypothetical protein